MQSNDTRRKALFPRWTNAIRPLATVAILGGLVYVVVLIAYATSPKTTNVGYAPTQPVPYSHALHVGRLGMDCRYCHTGVETGAKATLPPTQTCMNCHTAIWPESEKLLPVRESYSTGMPVEWVRVHDLPDFVYFNHSAHVTRGIGCVTCHGRVDQMETVYQNAPLSMAWCLDCHRAPEKNLRPVSEVTNMTWVAPKDPKAYGAELAAAFDINPPQDCSTCHR